MSSIFASNMIIRRDNKTIKTIKQEGLMEFTLNDTAFEKEGNSVPRLWVNLCKQAKYVWINCEHNFETCEDIITLHYDDNPESSCPAYMVFDSQEEVDSFVKQFNLQPKIDRFYKDGWEVQ